MVYLYRELQDREGVHYLIFIDKVKIYAQCYAAIANRMGDLDRLRCIRMATMVVRIYMFIS
jgi:plasmid segregation protein ParM